MVRGILPLLFSTTGCGNPNSDDEFDSESSGKITGEAEALCNVDPDRLSSADRCGPCDNTCLSLYVPEYIDSSAAENPSLSFSGSQSFGVAWDQDDKIWFQSLWNDGGRNGDTILIGEGEDPQIVFNGSNYKIFWEEKIDYDSAVLKTARVSVNGELLNSEDSLEIYVNRERPFSVIHSPIGYPLLTSERIRNPMARFRILGENNHEIYPATQVSWTSSSDTVGKSSINYRYDSDGILYHNIIYGKIESYQEVVPEEPDWKVPCGNLAYAHLVIPEATDLNSIPNSPLKSGGEFAYTGFYIGGAAFYFNEEIGEITIRSESDCFNEFNSKTTVPTGTGDYSWDIGSTNHAIAGNESHFAFAMENRGLSSVDYSIIYYGTGQQFGLTEFMKHDEYDRFFDPSIIWAGNRYILAVLSTISNHPANVPSHTIRLIAFDKNGKKLPFEGKTIPEN